MKVLLEGKTYRIEFQHGTSITEFTGRPQDWTICRIREVQQITEPRAVMTMVVAQGLAVRHYLDPPNREVARKVSLRKALDVMFPPEVPSRLHRFSLKETRIKRALFWDAYLNRKGKLADIVKLTIETANRIKQTLAELGEAASQ